MWLFGQQDTWSSHQQDYGRLSDFMGFEMILASKDCMSPMNNGNDTSYR